MFVPELRSLFQSFGEEAKRAILERLAAGRGLRGPSLARRKRETANSSILGGETVFAQVAAADVRPRADGFRVVAHGIEVTVFHAGRERGKSKQPPRKIMGATAADRKRWTKRTADELARQISAHMARTGGR